MHLKIKTSLYAAALGSLLLAQSAFAAEATHAAQKENIITFKNQRGSVLELRVLPDNKLAGFFTTAVASKSCPQAINVKRPIRGYTVENALSFTMAYPQCGSVISIIGNFDKTKNSIDTIWVVNRQASDVTHEGPGSRLIGHDTYTKIS
jgi:hypothetical protein